MIRRRLHPGERVPPVQVIFPEDEVSRTKQHFKKECDVNFIMAKFQKTGAITHLAKYGPEYGFAPAVDFHEAMNTVAQATEMFEALPSSLRSRFQEPGQFLEFVQDPENQEELVRLGLATRRNRVEDSLASSTAEGATQEVPAAAEDDS